MTNGSPAGDAARQGRFSQVPEWFTPQYVARLERFALKLRRAAGEHPGDLRSPARGGQAEFLEHRPYVAGDDFRSIDWNLAGRQDRLHVKVFAKERAARLVVLIDGSASMGTGSLAQSSKAQSSKARAAQQIAAGLAFAALRQGHAAHVGFGQSQAAGKVSWCQEQRDRAGFWALMHAFRAAPAPAGGGFARAVALLARTERPGSRVVLVTDGYEVEALEAALPRLIAARLDLVLVQVMSPAELSPPAFGPSSLADCEGEPPGGDRAGNLPGASLVFTHGDEAALAAYHVALGAFVERWERFCQRHGIARAFVRAAGDVLDTLAREFRRVGLLA